MLKIPIGFSYSSIDFKKCDLSIEVFVVKFYVDIIVRPIVLFFFLIIINNGSRFVNNSIGFKK